MKQISQAELKAKEKKGATVRRKMGAQTPKPKPEPKQEPKKEAQEPKKEAGHASMEASMKAYEASQEAQRILLAQNAEAIRGLSDTLKEALTPRGPWPYKFKIKRSKKGLLEEVDAIPQIEA